MIPSQATVCTRAPVHPGRPLAKGPLYRIELCYLAPPLGWSLRIRRSRFESLLLPAPAGMVPSAAARPTRRSPAPRAREDGPQLWPHIRKTVACSPHPLGCFQVLDLFRLPPTLLPAPAGMFPKSFAPGWTRPTVPRTRGDVPTRRCACSSTDRGSRFKARRQGCSRRWNAWKSARALLPATAGMFPRGHPPRGGPSAAPRTRGDVPRISGRNVAVGFCSPHPQGCSLAAVLVAQVVFLLPAPAGMFPSTPPTRPAPSTAPRTRGDVPV